MTITGETKLTFQFRVKIEEAVSLVSVMTVEEKLRAVYFWNIVSERLQEIVNNSTAEISTMKCDIATKKMCGITPIITEKAFHAAEYVDIMSDFTSENCDSQFNPNIANCTQGLNLTVNNDVPLVSDIFDVANPLDCINVETSRSNNNCDSFSKPPVHKNALQFPTDISGAPFLDDNTESNAAVNLTTIRNSAQQDTHSLLRTLLTSSYSQESICSNEDNLNRTTCPQTLLDMDMTKISDFPVAIPSCTDEITESNSPAIPSIPDLSKKIVDHEERIDVVQKNLHNDNTNHVCEFCSQEFSNSKKLETHRWTHTKPFKCSECHTQFSSKGNLIVHLRSHSGEKPFECPECSAKFSTGGNYKRHMKKHTGERPFQCPECNSRFTEKKSLSVHMRRHTGEKPYACDICGRTFAQAGILQSHSALHFKTRGFLCEHCGKSFTQKSQLRIHLLRHKGVKNYECATCSSHFLTKGDRDRHSKTHTGEKPFSCDLCGKSMTRQQSLNEHINRHYGHKPFKCKYCTKSFYEMSACYKHVKQHEKANEAEELNPEDLSKKSKTKKKKKRKERVFKVIKDTESNEQSALIQPIDNDNCDNGDDYINVETVSEDRFSDNSEYVALNLAVASITES